MKNVYVPTPAGQLKARSYLKSESIHKLMIKGAKQIIQIEDITLRDEVREEILCMIFVENALKSKVDRMAFYCLDEEDKVIAAKNWVRICIISNNFENELNRL